MKQFLEIWQEIDKFTFLISTIFIINIDRLINIGMNSILNIYIE